MPLFNYRASENPWTLACISLFFFSFLSIFLSLSSDPLFHVVRDTNYNGINKETLRPAKVQGKQLLGANYAKEEDPQPEGIVGYTRRRN